MKVAEEKLIENIRAVLAEKYENFLDLPTETQSILIIAEIQKGIEEAKTKK